jgi:hypothetical protein
VEAENREKGITSLNKKIEKMTREEKRRVYGGDRSALFSKLDILNETDIQDLKDTLANEEKMLSKGGKHQFKS